MGELTELERQLLDFAALIWRSAGLREQAIRERFGLSATRFEQLLNALLDRPEAWAYSPAMVKRLRRMRDGRRATRSLATVVSLD